MQRVKNLHANKTKPSAGGEDKVTYEMIRALSPLGQRSLLTALSDAFLEHNIKDSWRIIKIVPIPKKGKDLSDYRNFRPISKHKSASICLNEILLCIATLKKNGFKVILLALDINNAYNCVDNNLLNRMLLDGGFPAVYVKWIYKFLAERVLKLGDDQVVVSDGLPQGSCLSPFLFNLYTASLHNAEDESTKIFQFADDFLILTFDKDFDVAVNKMNFKIHEFSRRCLNLNLSFNLDRTKTIYIAKGSRKEVVISLDNTRIEQVKKLKFLARTINMSSTVGDHYEGVLSEARNSTNLIKSLLTVKGGLQPKESINFFKSFVRSKIEYSRTTTAHSPTSINRKIITFQNSVLRRCLGLTRSTPVHTIYALSGDLPVKFRAKFLTAREIINQKFFNYSTYCNLNTDVPVKSSYGYIFNQYAHIFDRINVNCSFVRSGQLRILTNILNRLKKSNLSREQIMSTYIEKIYNYKLHDFNIYATDASLAENAAGCAIIDVSNDAEYLFRIAHRTSSMFAELCAISRAIDSAISAGVEKLVIFTDSLLSCQVLNVSTTKNYCVASIHNKIRNSQIRECHLLWTPSHVGIDINERADAAAKNATSIGAELVVDLTADEAIRCIRDCLYEDWNSEYVELSREKGSFFANIYPRKPWFYGNHGLEPAAVKILNRLMTGHTFGKMYLNKIGVIDSYLCDVCNVNETSDHIIFKCTKFDNLRRKYGFFDKYYDVSSLLKSESGSRLPVDVYVLWYLYLCLRYRFGAQEKCCYIQTPLYALQLLHPMAESGQCISLHCLSIPFGTDPSTFASSRDLLEH
ncbi:RNA-directed DNA polymerase from mobile element jockey [Lucilia cuprina]|nr:RNA-directed DNA polymerase from mobile element jockey [Lucilia cuprina]